MDSSGELEVGRILPCDWEIVPVVVVGWIIEGLARLGLSLVVVARKGSAAGQKTAVAAVVGSVLAVGKMPAVSATEMDYTDLRVMLVE